MLWAMCPALKLMGMSCRHFAKLSSERLDRPLTASEALRLRFHGLMCHVCRPLPRQFENLRRLTRCCGQHSHNEAPAPAELPPEAREKIQAALTHESESADS
ncbi:MAG: hypothetical protein CJBNEKGG_02728 [Prosthecobacter sp.]|nr:hypothetical protein [Prosthecobacter sp.]